MNKEIDLSKSVYDICKENPDVINVLKDLGFDSITNSAMLNTAGRFMTIPKASEMKGIDLEKIKERFISKGFSIKS